ncbi:hypothetical protein ASD97_25940 [Streptomyces sp. Root63]|uniref:hypothetical protein n=1 Tax=unclassified Streptomyces TaxID=2593676 RepID=UPI0006F89F4C|nr:MULTISPECIES: hypothetical protein [unclassified Streptomyces]KQX43517.1 hypothetical protein ASD29_32245 [Streptomyces sp. Root1295]KRA34080.1 hypothetical protein ASD97_25940 [Streptomyces sp. Root63]
MQFKQGDKVICTLDGLEVEVEFGPVVSSVGNPSYLVKWSDGRSSLVWVGDLEPAPRFKVGQEVLYRDRAVELVSGPFLDSDGDLFWVVKGEKAHDQAWEMYMENV